MNSSAPVKAKVAAAALVVGYQPDIEVLDALLLGLLAEVEQVILLDNGGASAYMSAHPDARGEVVYVDMKGNQGLGAALNRGMREARAKGLRFVATFDQDSAPPLGMIGALHAAMLAHHERGVRCAAVGPTFYDRREPGQRRFPVFREEGRRIRVIHAHELDAVQEVDVLITSGMLVDSDTWAAGIQYDEGLIVDHTDSDWCFRARAVGYSLFVLSTVCMPHALSDSPPLRVLGVNLLRYSPLRRYYYFRNTAYFVRRPYVSGPWRRRLGAGLVVRLCSNLVIDKHRFRSLAMSLKGIWHGLRGRLGPYPS